MLKYCQISLLLGTILVCYYSKEVSVLENWDHTNVRLTLHKQIDEHDQLLGVLTTLLLVGWISVLCSLTITYLSLEDGSISTVENWERRCQRMCCYPCWIGANRNRSAEREVFHSLGQNIEVMFSDMQGLAVGDVISGLFLVRCFQKKRLEF